MTIEFRLKDFETFTAQDVDVYFYKYESMLNALETIRKSLYYTLENDKKLKFVEKASLETFIDELTKAIISIEKQIEEEKKENENE